MPTFTSARLSFIECVGMDRRAADSYPTATIADHTMAHIPGGMTVIGSYRNSQRSKSFFPRWVYLEPYMIATTATSQSQYQEVVGTKRTEARPLNHPATMVSHHDALDYIKKKGDKRLALPTSAEWENAARGPALNMQEKMEEETGSYKPRDFIDFARGRFENFVFSHRAGEEVKMYTSEDKHFWILRIFSGQEKQFHKLIAKGIPFFGWRAYPTPSGRLSHDELWYNQRDSAPVDWGPANPYGIKGMGGGALEWVEDWDWERGYHFRKQQPDIQSYLDELRKWKIIDSWNPKGPDEGDFRILRGTSWGESFDPMLYAAFFTAGLPRDRFYDYGFRVGAHLLSGTHLEYGTYRAIVQKPYEFFFGRD